MRNRLAAFLIVAVGLVFGLLFARQLVLSRGLPYGQFAEKRLHVLTYSTFMSSNGPGKKIFADFETEHHYTVDIVTVSDAGLLVERARLAEESGNPFDVIVGLDQLGLAAARSRLAWRPVAVGQKGGLERFDSAPFVPFDWSPLTFIYRKSEVEPPEKFLDMLDHRFHSAFALQDPRASSPGAQFLVWVKETQKGDARKFLHGLKPNVQSVSPSWAFAYGLFEKHQVKFVFSYLTSLAFHWGVEKNKDYQAISFTIGHPVQVEYAGVLEKCRACDVAELLVKKLIEPGVQKIVMEKNFMFPVIEGVEKGTVFEKLPKLKTLPPSVRAVDFHDWDQVFKN